MTQRSPLAWVGGKSLLADRIIERFPAHHAYCEVFAGAAWVLFKKPESKVEIINDINRELVTLYRCIKHHLPALVEQFRWMLVARDQFDDFMKTPAETLTDIQRSARFYYLIRTAFGAKWAGATFGASATQPPRFNLLRVEEDLSAAHIRLSRVLIENRPYLDILKRYDKPGTLFYLDPPYWGCESDYGVGLFSREDFTTLAGVLDGIKGKAVVSLNDTPGVREVFANFKLHPVTTRYSLAAKKDGGAAAKELLITNF